MKHSIALLAAITLLLARPVWAFSLPEYETYQLDNGLTVYLMQQDEVPLVDIRLAVRAGAVHDGDKPGMASTALHALKLGSGDLSRAELEDLLDFHGAELTIEVDKEMSVLGLSIAAQDSGKLMPVFRDLITAPSFDPDEYEKYRQRTVAKLRQEREIPRNMVASIFDDFYYGDHPYGNPSSGEPSALESMPLEDVEAFYRRFYVPTNSALVIVGDFEAGKLKAQVANLFSGWRGQMPETKPLPPVPVPSESGVLLVDKPDSRETTMMIGGRGIELMHRDQVAATVINTILGGRFTSWLNDELRVNSGLTYGAHSQFQQGTLAGNFRIYTFTKTATTFDTIDLAMATYERLWEQGINRTQLESAKAYVKGQFPPDYETGSQLANLLCKIWGLGIDTSYIDEFEQKVDALDVEGINRIARELFPRENLRIVLIGQAKALRKRASDYGEVRLANLENYRF